MPKPNKWKGFGAKPVGLQAKPKPPKFGGGMGSPKPGQTTATGQTVHKPSGFKPGAPAKPGGFKTGNVGGPGNPLLGHVGGKKGKVIKKKKLLADQLVQIGVPAGSFSRPGPAPVARPVIQRPMILQRERTAGGVANTGDHAARPVLPGSPRYTTRIRNARAAASAPEAGGIEQDFFRRQRLPPTFAPMPTITQQQVTGRDLPAEVIRNPSMITNSPLIWDGRAFQNPVPDPVVFF